PPRSYRRMPPAHPRPQRETERSVVHHMAGSGGVGDLSDGHKIHLPRERAHSFAEAIVKCLDVDLELLLNYTSCLWLIVFSIVPRPRVGAGVRKHFAYSKLFRDHRPVFL